MKSNMMDAAIDHCGGVLVELLQMEVQFVSPHPGQIRLPPDSCPRGQESVSEVSNTVLTGVLLVSSRLWPLLLGQQTFQGLCAHVELDLCPLGR